MNVFLWIVSERILEHIRVPKEKPLKVKAFRGSLVARVVLLGLLPRECHFWGALLQEPLIATLPQSFFTPGLISKLNTLK